MFPGKIAAVARIGLLARWRCCSKLRSRTSPSGSKTVARAGTFQAPSLFAPPLSPALTGGECGGGRQHPRETREVSPESADGLIMARFPVASAPDDRQYAAEASRHATARAGTPTTACLKYLDNRRSCPIISPTTRPTPAYRARVFPALACAAALAAPAHAHEFWIEPTDPSPTVGEPLEANLHTGQYLSADPSSWDPRRFVRLELVDADGSREITGERMDLPAVRIPVRSPGPQTLVGETRPQSVRYDSFEKFEDFTAFEGAPEIAERHVASGLPTVNITELYTRYAKALVRADGGPSADRGAPPGRALGLELELVALDDPYASDADAPLGFELLLDGEPLADVQVALFHRTGPNAGMPPKDATGEIVMPNGVTRTLARTGADGRVSFDRPGAGVSLVSAVLIRRPDARTMLESGAMWESLWASLTFGTD